MTPDTWDNSSRRRPGSRAQLLPLGIVEPLDNVGGVTVGDHAPGVLASAVLAERDLTQSDDGIHSCSVPAESSAPAAKSFRVIQGRVSPVR